MSPPRRHTITAITVGAPGTWASLPVAEVEGGGSRGSRARTAPEALLEPLRRMVEPSYLPALVADVRRLHPHMIRESHLRVGVWVPDARDPAVRGVMLLDLLVGDTAGPSLTPEIYQEMGEADMSGVEVQWKELEETTIAAGRCLVQREVSKPRRMPLQYRILWTVFPPGSVDAAQFTFTTPHLLLVDALTQDAAVIAGTLAVTLTEVP